MIHAIDDTSSNYRRRVVARDSVKLHVNYNEPCTHETSRLRLVDEMCDSRFDQELGWSEHKNSVGSSLAPSPYLMQRAIPTSP